MCQSLSECVFLVGTRFAEGIMASGRSRRFNRPNTYTLDLPPSEVADF